MRTVVLLRTLARAFLYPRATKPVGATTPSHRAHPDAELIHRNLQYGEKILEEYFERKDKYGSIASNLSPPKDLQPEQVHKPQPLRFKGAVRTDLATHDAKQVDLETWNRAIDPYFLPPARSKPRNTQPSAAPAAPADVYEKQALTDKEAKKKDYFLNPMKHIQGSLKYLGYYGPEYDLLSSKAKRTLIEEHLGKKNKMKLMQKELKNEMFKLNKVAIELEQVRHTDKLSRLSARRQAMILGNVETAVHQVLYGLGSPLERATKQIGLQVSRVEISKSYRKVKVHYFLNDADPPADLEQRLDAITPDLRMGVQLRIDMKYAPEFEFIFDKSISRREEYDSLLGTSLPLSDAERQMERLFELARQKDDHSIAAEAELAAIRQQRLQRQSHE